MTVRGAAVAVALLSAVALPVPGLLTNASAASGRDRASGTITVFAAASLTESFTALGRQFEREHHGAHVRFDFDASSTLAQQIDQGAPADVFASADQENMRRVVDRGDVTATPRTFARNRLEIAVETGNPKHVGTLKDLRDHGLVVVLCADAVPCGRFAAQSLRKAGVTLSPASKEANVKAVLTKVSLGEADAGIVYTTDVEAARGSVTGVPIPDRQNVLASYPIATVKTTRHAGLARAFVDFVRSRAGEQILQRAGFLSP